MPSETQKLALVQSCYFIQNSQGLGPSCPKPLCCTVLSSRALTELFNLIFLRGKGTGYYTTLLTSSENPGWSCPCFIPFPFNFSKALILSLPWFYAYCLISSYWSHFPALLPAQQRGARGHLSSEPLCNTLGVYSHAQGCCGKQPVPFPA